MIERYVVVMKDKNGNWRDWGRTNDLERANLMLQTARCYGECKIIDREKER